MKLICPECRRENEPERIYCHDCGARLDRTALRKEKPKVEAPEETQKRLRSMFDPRFALLRHRLLFGVKVIVAAALAAAVIQMIRPPDMPETPANAMELPDQINLDLENAAEGGPSRQYTEQQINAYLAYSLKSKQKALSSYLRFEGASALLEEGLARFTIERSLMGYSIYTTIGFNPKVEGEKVTARTVSGAVGRLPIHPALMSYGNFLFADVRRVLSSELHSMAKLHGVEVHPKMVLFIARPRA